MTPQIIFQGLVVMLATIVSIFQIKNGLPKSRSKLRQDLEIFNLLDPKDKQNYDLVKNSINRDIETIYTPRKEKKDRESQNSAIKDLFEWYKLNYQKIDLVVGILSFSTGTIWILFLTSQKSVSAWLIVSIILIVGGLGELLVFFEYRQRKY